MARITVPYYSQLGENASYAPGDCGPAALNGCLHYFKGKQVATVDELSRATGYAAGFTETNVNDLIRLAGLYGVRARWKGNLSLADLEAEIAAGRPVLVLVDYRELPYRFDPGYEYAHFVVVTGVEDGRVYYNDPYWWGTQGKNVWALDYLFDKAWKSVARFNYSPRQAILFEATPDPNFAKVVWAVEEAARILQREGLTREHDYIVNQILPPLVALRDERSK